MPSPKITRTVTLEKSRYGSSLIPTLTVSGFGLNEYRAQRAELYRLAALLETMSGDAQWAIEVSRESSIHIETIGDSKPERDAAMAMLRKAVSL